MLFFLDASVAVGDSFQQQVSFWEVQKYLVSGVSRRMVLIPSVMKGSFLLLLLLCKAPKNQTEAPLYYGFTPPLSFLRLWLVPEEAEKIQSVLKQFSIVNVDIWLYFLKFIFKTMLFGVI